MNVLNESVRYTYTLARRVHELSRGGETQVLADPIHGVYVGNFVHVVISVPPIDHSLCYICVVDLLGIKYADKFIVFMEVSPSFIEDLVYSSMFTGRLVVLHVLRYVYPQTAFPVLSLWYV